jgi:ATP-binding cassette subfamily F protein uup
VLILDEPTNDLDTDMLAAIEDLLDSWPGTLLVVSHDRYFIERVTDQQYAILDGHLRHLPGGVDEYLRLRARALSERDDTKRGAGTDAAAPASASPSLSGADLRAAQKEVSALERRLEKLESQIGAARVALADHDQADYVGLGAEMARIGELEKERDGVEERWFELTEQLG